MTLWENNVQLKQFVECACGGNAACSTCHVYVDEAYMDRLPAPEENERDMLDLAMDTEPTSRLGCQLKLTPDCDGITFVVPGNATNLYGSR